MLCPGVTQEWVDEGELPRERTKNRRWRRPYDMIAEATRMIGADGELDCLSAYIRLRESDKSEDKAEKGCRCKSTDNRAMGLAAPWYHRGGTSMESSIPCSHGGRALVVKGVKEVENAKTNSKCQDKAEGQRPRNFIRQRQNFHGVIDPLLSWRESIGHKRGRGGGECKGKLQVPRQGGRAVAKELHNIGVDELLIKITESEGLKVDVGVLDQGTK
ncbi:hypothetical protein BHM03_00015911 [Ensete ventricosum]|nr:hypothetical protein BHM03_00015911 [Ensete ventricosum]